jgi:hypothetical protein
MSLLAQYLAPDSKDVLAKRMLELFFIRRDAYGLEKPSGWKTVKQPVTIDLIEQHLNGEPCLGAHPISLENQCKWIGWDLDTKEKADVVYSRAIKRYPKTAVLLNSTGGRGYHIRIFFNRSIPAEDANRLARELVEGIEGVEYYPKQAWISKRGFGNFMRLPLGKHQKTGRTGKLIFPKSLLEIKPCAPPFPSSFEQVAKQCQYRIHEAKMSAEGHIVKLDLYDCTFGNSTTGSCQKENCPLLNRTRARGRVWELGAPLGVRSHSDEPLPAWGFYVKITNFGAERVRWNSGFRKERGVGALTPRPNSKPYCL